MKNYVLITTGERSYLRNISPLLSTAEQVETIQKNYFPKEHILDWQTFEAADLDQEERTRELVEAGKY